MFSVSSRGSIQAFLQGIQNNRDKA